ncbi:MAG TPA: hypothetical protein ENI41_00790 [Deltaproteobacteria bacterium]|nr:hypothetical protein [Deltaproteobacteria bacterium]
MIMKVKKKIHAAVEEMGARELSKIYDYINAIKRMQAVGPRKKGAKPIERIHEMVRRSRSSWAKAVIEDREDRV